VGQSGEKKYTHKQGIYVYLEIEPKNGGEGNN